ncbi:hypothetical protein B0H14DRAFT_3052804 [Mycena olivaceomarginata]|nr:hypothetical protein B0H14DRAFT_3052804 [Mycena olivaceomarginata]
MTDVRVLRGEGVLEFSTVIGTWHLSRMDFFFLFGVWYILISPNQYFKAVWTSKKVRVYSMVQCLQVRIKIQVHPCNIHRQSRAQYSSFASPRPQAHSPHSTSGASQLFPATVMGLQLRPTGTFKRRPQRRRRSLRERRSRSTGGEVGAVMGGGSGVVGVLALDISEQRRVFEFGKLIWRGGHRAFICFAVRFAKHAEAEKRKDIAHRCARPTRHVEQVERFGVPWPCRMSIGAAGSRTKRESHGTSEGGSRSEWSAVEEEQKQNGCQL